MKFWIDENVPKVFSNALARAGYETLKSPSRTQDLTILRFAARANAVVVTFDQDFKKHVISEKRVCAGIIWLRHIPPRLNEEMIRKLLQLIEAQQEKLSTSFITLTPNTTEIIELTNVLEQQPEVDHASQRPQHSLRNSLD